MKAAIGLGKITQKILERRQELTASVSMPEGSTPSTSAGTPTISGRPPYPTPDEGFVSRVLLHDQPMSSNSVGGTNVSLPDSLTPSTSADAPTSATPPSASADEVSVPRVLLRDKLMADVY